MAQRILFVTGKLAEPSLRRVVDELGPRAGFDPVVQVVGISVAALMTTEWLSRRIEVPEATTRVILPGWCSGDLSVIEQRAGVPVELGPKDLRDLPEHFGAAARPADYGAYDIEIIAEINHAPRLATNDIIAMAKRYRDEGADVIDVGCDPGSTWLGVGDAVRRLRGEGFRVSIDSFDHREIEVATRAGAELVLSVNSPNVDAAADWGAEVVAIPDDIATLGGLDLVIERLESKRVRYRIDPVIEPIGFGFAASLGRYLEARRRWPGAEIMMGIGNLTELTDVDSAGVNALLIGFCQELGIRSVLTTEVINWARSSVREIDLARRLMYHAVKHRVLPKHLEPKLVMLRDASVHEFGDATLADLARRISDPNFRLFAERGEIHAMNSRGYSRSENPFALFRELLERNAAADKLDKSPQSKPTIDASHAFYLGFEMAKAFMAIVLSKEYRQDQPLDWGFLTKPESNRDDEHVR